MKFYDSTGRDCTSSVQRVADYDGVEIQDDWLGFKFTDAIEDARPILSADDADALIGEDAPVALVETEARKRGWIE